MFCQFQLRLCSGWSIVLFRGLFLNLVMFRWWFGKVLTTFEVCMLMLSLVVIHLLSQNFYVISAVVTSVGGLKEGVWDHLPACIFEF